MNISNLTNSQYLIVSSVSSHIAYIFVVVVCCTSVVSNLLAIVTLTNRKFSIGNFSFNALQLAVAECFLAISTLVSSVNRLLVDFQDSLICRVSINLMICSMISVNAQSFCLALDRMLAILFPVWYHNATHTHEGRRRFHLVNIILWIVALAIGITGQVMYGKVSNAKICMAPYIFPKGVYLFNMACIVTLTVLTVICYLVILLQCGIVRSFATNPQFSESYAVCKSVGIVVTCHFCTWLLGVAVASVASHVNPKIVPFTTPYVTALGPINGTITFPLYLYFVKQMKLEFINTFRCIWRTSGTRNQTEANLIALRHLLR